MSDKREDGGSAFPNGISLHTPGMTLRDWFAGQALAGWLACNNTTGSSQDFADMAYALADAMLTARKAGS